MALTRDITVEWDCNWKTSVDAFNESYHVQGIHPQLMWYLHDLDIQIDCYERHNRYLIPFGTWSPRVRRPPSIPDPIKVIMKKAGMDPADYDEPLENIRRDVQQRKRKHGPAQGKDYSRLNDDQLTDDYHYLIFPNVTLNVHADDLMLFRQRPHPTDPDRMFYDIWTFELVPDGQGAAGAAASTSISSTATSRSAWCSTRTRRTCPACRPACIRRASRASGSARRSCASGTSTRSSTTTLRTGRQAARRRLSERRASAKRVRMTAPLSAAQLQRAYRQMKTIREFEERLHVEIATGEIAGFTHLYAGQEAVAVGVCEHLTDADYIVTTHRGHGHCIAKGCDVIGMMKEIYGRADGLCKGKGGSMHIADVTMGMLGANGIVGGGPPLAVGAAHRLPQSRQRQGQRRVRRRRRCNQGTAFEAMNMAVVLKVPAIFVFENNHYSEHTGGIYAVGSKDIAGRARGFGMPAEKCDGADFFSVYEAAGRLLEHAARGEGPATLEATITRFYGHFEGDPQRYRAKDEVEAAARDDGLPQDFPRARHRGTLARRRATLDAIDAEVLELIDGAVTDGQGRAAAARVGDRRPTSTSPTERAPCHRNHFATRSTRRMHLEMERDASHHRARRGRLGRRRRHGGQARGLGRHLRRHQGPAAEVRREPRDRHADLRIARSSAPPAAPRSPACARSPS